MRSRSKQRDPFGRPVHVTIIVDGPGIVKRYRIAIGALSCILAGIRTENKYLME
jgi:hypothetical protein